MEWEIIHHLEIESSEGFVRLCYSHANRVAESEIFFKIQPTILKSPLGLFILLLIHRSSLQFLP